MVFNRYFKFFLILIFISIIVLIFLFKNQKQEQITTLEQKIENGDTVYNSNIIENVNYTTKDTDGNEYVINAVQGEIDYANSNIIYLCSIYVDKIILMVH